MSKTVRKASNFKDRVLKPNKDDVLQLGGPEVDFQRQTVNAFEELWFKTLRNKGTDNLTPEEKVVSCPVVRVVLLPIQVESLNNLKAGKVS